MSLRLRLYDLSLDASRFETEVFSEIFSESKRLDFSLYGIMPFCTELKESLVTVTEIMAVKVFRKRASGRENIQVEYSSFGFCGTFFL